MSGFGPRCLLRLQGVHPDLVRVATAALSTSLVPFVITEGVRSVERQAYLFASGHSRTLQSAHLDGSAVDIAASPGGKISWLFDDYLTISKAWKLQASLLGVPIIWGGDWPRFRDGPHYQLGKRFSA